MFFFKNLTEALSPSSCLPRCLLQACQLAVVTTPRDSHALGLLGLAQLAQYGNDPNSDRSKEALADACLSFQASIELENAAQSGEPPEQLSSESASLSLSGAIWAIYITKNVCHADFNTMDPKTHKSHPVI